MCTFVPGEVIALGPINDLLEVGSGLPGVVSDVRPLVSEIGDISGDSDLAAMGTLTLKTDPGLEIYAASRLSARLTPSIEARKAIVDLNHILPLSVASMQPEPSLRLTPRAEKEVASIRSLLRSMLSSTPGPRRIAVLDSGLLSEYVAHRDIQYYDYSDSGQLRPDSPKSDPHGHGTKVVSILDRILPPEVELSVGRLPTESNSLTELCVAHALGDIIAREQPQIVNLSVSLRSDWFVCPLCRERVAAPTFLSSFFPLIIRLGGNSVKGTLTVMAAGNTGQYPNSRWLTEDVSTLLFAVAENRSGSRTRYSSAPEGPRADLFSASAFGGDDPDDLDAQGVFLDGTYGTSFAAPFVSAVALLTNEISGMTKSGAPAEFGEITRQLIELARNGSHLRLPARGVTDASQPQATPNEE